MIGPGEPCAGPDNLGGTRTRDRARGRRGDQGGARLPRVRRRDPPRSPRPGRGLAAHHAPDRGAAPFTVGDPSSPFSSPTREAVGGSRACRGLEACRWRRSAPAQLRARFFGQGFVTDTGVFDRARARRRSGPAGGGRRRHRVTPARAVYRRSSRGPDRHVQHGLREDERPAAADSGVLSGQGRSHLGIVPPGPEAGCGGLDPADGVSDQVPLVGVSLPRGLVERWNADLAGEATPEYVQLTVVVAARRTSRT
jgi:hypothetical protein